MRSSLSMQELLAVVTIPALMIATAITAWFVFAHYAGVVEGSTQEMLEAVADAKRTQVEVFLHERFADAEVVAGLPAVRGAVAEHRQRTAAEQRALLTALGLDAVAARYGYHDIRLLDPELESVAAVQPGEGLDPVEREAIGRALKSGHPTLVNLHRAADGTVSFGVTTPVFADAGPAGPPAGAVYLEMDAQQRLFPLVTRWPARSASAEALLLEFDGPEVVYASPLKSLPATPPLALRRPVSEPGFVGAAMAGATSPVLIAGIDYVGREVIGAAVPIAGTQWIMEAKVAREEVRQPLRYTRNLVIAGTILSFGLLAFAGRQAWRVAAAEAIAQRLQSAERYRAASEASIDGYLEVNEAGRIVHANDALVAQTGYPRNEVVGAAIAKFEAAMTPAEIAAALGRLRSGRGARFQSRWRRQDGSIFDIDVSTSHVRLPNGSVFCAFQRDITPTLAAQRRLERLNVINPFLNHANAAIFALDTREAVLAEFCETAVRDAGFVLAWAGLVDEAAGRVTPVSMVGPAAGYAREVEITTDPALATSHGPTRLSMLERRAIYVNDFRTSPLTAPWRGLAEKWGIRASASVPLIVDDAAIAAITFYSAEPGYFEPDLRAPLEEAARNVSLVLESIAAGAEQRKAEAAQRASMELFSRAFAASPVAMQIHSLAAHTIRFVNRAHVRIFGWEPPELASEADWFARVYPDPVARAERAAQWYGTALPHAAANPGEIETSPEVAMHCRDGAVRTCRGFMTIAGDDVIVQWQDLTDVRLAEEKIAAYVRELEGTVETTLQAVAVMVELRDPYTAGHERRVGLIAAAIARELGWPEKQCHVLELIGLVHDIGKISVPIEILTKPTRLTALEYEFIKTHAATGYEILKNVKASVPIARVVRQHHERLDGSGYPDGLHGPDILPEARILAVADVVESMASHRPYRPSRGLPAALEEIESHRGTWFDADAVDALIRLIREQGYELPV